MASIPHDMSDLYLAPVVLTIESQLAEFGALSLSELAVSVESASTNTDLTREQREAGLLFTLAQFVETHGWALSWDPRGLRLTHGSNTLVLGIPEVFSDYLNGASRPGQSANTH